MPKLLDVIKEKGFTHEQVLTLIENESNKPDTEIEESVVEESVEDDSDKPEDKIELHLTEVETPSEEEPESEEKEDEITLTKEELDKQITIAVEEKLKAQRKVPSKGRIVDKPQNDTPSVKRNWFEEIV